MPHAVPLSTVQGSECVHYLEIHYNTALQELLAVGVGLINDPMGTLMEILHTFLEHERWGEGAKS